MHRKVRFALGSLLLLLGCGEAPPDTPEQAAPPHLLPLESARSAIAPGAALSLELTGATRTYSLSFELAGEAVFGAHTEALPQGPEVDTVLSLYGSDGPRGRRLLGQNDDADVPPFSALRRALGPGRYELVVRGFGRRTFGAFLLATACEGAGCPAPPRSCLFGETFSDLRTSEDLQILSETWIRSSAGLSTLAGAQLVLAVQQSSHTDVDTPEQALARVDQQEVRQMEVIEAAGERAFTVYEYGVGDNSYGGIFARDTTSLVAHIHDGDLLECTAEG